MKNVTLNSLTNDPERSANWCVASIDETYAWTEDIQEKAGKVYGVYFVNLMEPTNLCDPAVNYPAHFLYNVFESTDKFSMDELEAINYDNGGNAFTYLNEYTRCIDCVPAYMPSSWFERMKEEGEDWEEDQIEYYNCNHVI